MAAHTHRAVPLLHAVYAWTHCVARAGASCCGKAHGAITLRDECRCGAIRLTESNGSGYQSRMVGEWREQNEPNAR